MLRGCLNSFPVLVLLDIKLLLILTTVANDAAVGGLLRQQADNFKEHKIIVRSVHRLTKRDERYAISEEER